MGMIRGEVFSRTIAARRETQAESIPCFRCGARTIRSFRDNQTPGIDATCETCGLLISVKSTAYVGLPDSRYLPLIALSSWRKFRPDSVMTLYFDGSGRFAWYRYSGNTIERISPASKDHPKGRIRVEPEIIRV